MSDPPAAAGRQVSLTAAARELIWQNWDNVYIVYQPSSTETHVFNETTALILESLEQGSLSMGGIMDWIVRTVGIGEGDLVEGNLSFAVERLEELGLTECSDEASVDP